MVKTNESKQALLNISIARFFFGNKIACNIVKNKLTLQLFETICSGYKPPNRKHLAGSLLDTVTEEVDRDVKTNSRNVSRTLQMDGWSSVRNDFDHGL